LLTFLFKPKIHRNRRRAPRKKTRNLVLLTIPAEEKMMNLVDLSESGAQITSSKLLQKNKTVHLKINLAEQNKEVFLKGKVVWQRQATRRGRLYRVGIAFIEISQEAWMKLHSYISRAQASHLPPRAA
jgi:hypothetical protein